MSAKIPFVTKEKLEDSAVDVFGELSEGIAEAFYTAIDAAAIFGKDSPFSSNLKSAVTKSSSIICASSSP